MSDRPEGKAVATGPEPAEEALTELVGSTSRRMAEYAKDWIVSFDAALKGEYTADRLAKDATRMASQLIRDTAKLLVSGYEFLEMVADLPKPTTAPPTGTAPGGQAPAEGAGRGAKGTHRR